mmetsp:Transcript_6679/g.17344  ORF Transcript_6679/g.17344 Transcript_6679/m.17344 type:complete len:216 (-) Transcript_6679:207-854(-)
MCGAHGLVRGHQEQAAGEYWRAATGCAGLRGLGPECRGLIDRPCPSRHDQDAGAGGHLCHRQWGASDGMGQWRRRRRAAPVQWRGTRTATRRAVLLGKSTAVRAAPRGGGRPRPGARRLRRTPCGSLGSRTRRDRCRGSGCRGLADKSCGRAKDPCAGRDGCECGGGVACGVARRRTRSTDAWRSHARRVDRTAGVRLLSSIRAHPPTTQQSVAA